MKEMKNEKMMIETKVYVEPVMKVIDIDVRCLQTADSDKAGSVDGSGFGGGEEGDENFDKGWRNYSVFGSYGF